jgi:hypothetical protein
MGAPSLRQHEQCLSHSAKSQRTLRTKNIGHTMPLPVQLEPIEDRALPEGFIFATTASTCKRGILKGAGSIYEFKCRNPYDKAFRSLLHTSAPSSVLSCYKGRPVLGLLSVPCTRRERPRFNLSNDRCQASNTTSINSIQYHITADRTECNHSTALLARFSIK